MNVSVIGAKGGGGGKGGSGGGAPRTPVESPDNLLADSTAYLIDVVSEGPIEGWADPAYPAKCIYFDDTPLQNPDGSFNFKDVQFWLRNGTPDQEPVPGFSAVENEVGVSSEVKHSLPIARSVTDSDIDAVRIKVGVGQLSTLNKENGDMTGASVDFSIDLQVGNGGWYTVADLTLSGKTTSGYQRSYRFELPDIRPVTMRVRRRTPDQTENHISDDLYFVSYTEIIDAKLSYPDTAYVALAVPAKAFGGNIPRRSYRLKGMKCWVPSDYDPNTRTYNESGIWNGTFKLVYSNNPAYFLYTVLIENRWGLGERIADHLVDKWRIYQIGKYCDQLVPNGSGGSEPRFTMNGVMNTREAAYQVITQLSTAFRGVTYWGAGAVVPVQDAPSDPVKLVINANVVDGTFNYSSTSLAARHTAVVASFRDPNDHFTLKAGIVYEDHEAIQRYDRRQSDINLPFSTSRGEALRAAKWLVETDINQTETVNYQAGYDHAALRPGDKILVSDKYRVGFRLEGRITSIAANRMAITVDSPLNLMAGESYSILLSSQLGDFSEILLTAGQVGNLSDLMLPTALNVKFKAGANFILKASNLAPKLFRIISNTPEKHLFSIVAIEDDATKYARIENGIRVDSSAPYILPNINRPKPVVNISSKVYYRETPAGLAATISWQVQAAQNVSAFHIMFIGQDQISKTLGEQSTQSIDVMLSSNYLGPYTIRIRARNSINTWSEYASHSFFINSEIFTPLNVSGFRIRVLGDQAFLSWDKGELIVDHYHIRYSANLGAAWNEAIDVASNISGREASVPALPGVYLIKAVSVFGYSSGDASILTSNILNLEYYNVVEAIAAEPDFLGILDDGISREQLGLALYSDRSIFDWDDLFAISDIYTHGGVAANANYQLEQKIDLGSVYTSRITASLSGYGVNTDFSIFSWDDVFAVTDIFGDVGETWRFRLQIATTDQDPDIQSSAWSDWQDIFVGDYRARGYKFRVCFYSDNPNIAVILKSVQIKIDMPDRIEKGSDILCPLQGIVVNFTPPFMAVPSIVVDGQELPSGAISIRTQVSRSGFKQQFVGANGTPVAASFDFQAAGYGRDL